MRILSLHPYIPHPLNSGGILRSHHTLAALVDEHEVTFAAQWRNGEDVSDWDFARRFAELPVLVPCASDASVNPARERLRRGAPQAWFGKPRSIRGHDCDSFWEALAGLPLDSYDVVHVRTFHLIPYALAIRRLCPAVRLVLDLDDVQSVFKLRAIRSANMRWISRWRFQSYLDYGKIRLYERRFLKEFDSVWICSELDFDRLAGWIGAEKVVCIPNGVDSALYEDVVPAPDSRKLLFIGDFRHDPNESGIRWFHDAVLPRIRREVPRAELWLVGRDPPQSILQLHRPQEGVHVTGCVPSVQPYLEGAAVSIVPLHVGSGTRLKILEAMAAGVAVVSTTIGAEGIPAVDGENILLADTPASMAEACVSLLQDPARRGRMGSAGRQLAREKYDWSSVQRMIRDCFASLHVAGRLPRPGNCGVGI